MQPPADHTVAYTSNRADGGTNHYGHVYNLSGGPSRPDRNQCLRDLKITDPREDKIRIEQDKDRLLKQCYGWILEDASFRCWRAEGETRLLWIKGDPGKGKTMMTVGLIDELSSGDGSSNGIWRKLAMFKLASQPCLLAYFFCQSTRPELNSAASVLRGLIYMLVVQREDLIRHVQKPYETEGGQLFEGPSAIYALTRILSDILNDASLPMTYLLVDALDECVSGLSSLLKIITDDRLAKRPRIKWLVTSRNLPEIGHVLSPGSLSNKVNLEINATLVSKAVMAFVDFKVQQLAAAQKYDNNMQTEVQRVLYHKAEGTFLWVSLACKEIESVPLYRTGEVLQKLPSGIDPLYDRMMEQILTQDADTRRFCTDILQSVTLAYRPLQLKELAVVAGLPIDSFISIQSVADLVSRCGSFLTVSEGTVSFIHLSAKDYFKSGNGQQIFDREPMEDQRQISNNLLDAMKGTLRRDMCNLRKPGTRIKEAIGQIKGSDLPQIAYACEYWIDHLCAYPPTYDNILLGEDGKAQRFLQQHLLHWLEAMSLLKKIPDAIAAIRKLQSALTESNSIHLSHIVHDILRFVMWSGVVIQESPLQVYYSALLFAPERSVVRSQFNQEMPDWINVKLDINKDWGCLLQTLEGHTDYVVSVAFSPQGDRLASASWDHTVRLWDANTGRLLQILEDHMDWVTSVTFSPRGDRLASASRDTVRLWDTNTGRSLQTLKGHNITSVALSLHGDTLALALGDNSVQLWDANTARLLQTLKGHTRSLTNVAFSPQGNLLASGSEDNTIRLWDANTGRPLQTLEGHTSSVTSVAFSPHGDRLASASGDHSVRLWDANTGQPLQTLECRTPSVTTVTFSPHGDRLALASWGNGIRLWDANTGRPLQTLEGHTNHVTSVAFSPHGDRLASASWDKTVRLWDANTGDPLLQTLEGHTNHIKIVALSPHGDRLASASDKIIRLWDVNKGRLLQMLEGHTGSVTSVAFSPQGNRLASASWNPSVQLWDANTGEPLQTLKGHTRSVTSVAFSPQGDRLASASRDETVRLWDANTGQPLQTLEGHTDSVTSVAFSLQGNRLGSASEDSTIRLWDANTFRPLQTLKVHTSFVTSVAFSPQGDRLASVSWDNTVRLWDANTGRSLQMAEDYTGFSEASGLFKDVSRKGQWVLYKTEDILLLPSQYEISCSTSHGNIIALGTWSGQLLLLTFAE